jgi:hypothetical protein
MGIHPPFYSYKSYLLGLRNVNDQNLYMLITILINEIDMKGLKEIINFYSLLHNWFHMFYIQTAVKYAKIRDYVKQLTIYTTFYLNFWDRKTDCCTKHGLNWTELAQHKV